mmetsp:Transcript_26357/g.29569  ORF Transcript_26357/g.29569 Transcript_26357/m.29569 type:complete len:117 (+) Transcript_26357:381-731(+)
MTTPPKRLPYYLQSPPPTIKPIPTTTTTTTTTTTPAPLKSSIGNIKIASPHRTRRLLHIYTIHYSTSIIIIAGSFRVFGRERYIHCVFYLRYSMEAVVFRNERGRGRVPHPIIMHE